MLIEHTFTPLSTHEDLESCWGFLFSHKGKTRNVKSSFEALRCYFQINHVFSHFSLESIFCGVSISKMDRLLRWLGSVFMWQSLRQKFLARKLVFHKLNNFQVLLFNVFYNRRIKSEFAIKLKVSPEFCIHRVFPRRNFILSLFSSFTPKGRLSRLRICIHSMCRGTWRANLRLDVLEAESVGSSGQSLDIVKFIHPLACFFLLAKRKNDKMENDNKLKKFQ